MKLAILDMDGTLHPKSLGIELLRAQIERGVFDPAVGRRILALFQDYRTRRLPRSTAVDTIFRLCAEGLVGLSQYDVRKVARDVWQNERENLFPFVPQLVELLRARDYHPLLLTGSPLEIVEPVAESLGIVDRWGSLFETEMDRYTGRIARSLRSSEEKRRITLAFAEGKSIEWERSFAIGDSESDYGVLGMVGKPVVFEPDASLSSLPHGPGWHHASRHDVVELLERIL